MSATWILRMDAPGTGPRVAIKDLIDVAGTPTTAACAVLARQAEPAERDAACMAGLRAADVAIVGKANLHELACGGTGDQPALRHAREPVRPRLHPRRQLQRQRGGAGRRRGRHRARQRHGRLDPQPVGVLWHGRAQDHVGPHPAGGRVAAGALARHGRARWRATWPASSTGWRCSSRASRPPTAPSPVIGRVRLPDIDPRIDAAVDAALAASELEVVEVELPGWDAAGEAGFAVMFHEYWVVDHHLYEQDAAGLGDDIVERMEQGRDVTPAAYQQARAHRAEWRAELAAAFERAPVLAWPTLAMFPTRMDEPFPNTRRTGLPVNHAGHPSLALPVPTGGRFPTSVQLVGPDMSEDLLCATGLVVEAAARSLS